MKLKKILLILVLLTILSTYGIKTTNGRITFLNTDSNTVDTNAKSNENRLASIKLDDHELEFFNENVLEYDIEVEKEVESIKISATKKDDKAVIGGDLGDQKLEQYG